MCCTFGRECHIRSGIWSWPVTHFIVQEIFFVSRMHKWYTHKVIPSTSKKNIYCSHIFKNIKNNFNVNLFLANFETFISKFNLHTKITIPDTVLDIIYLPRIHWATHHTLLSMFELIIQSHHLEFAPRI